MSRVLVVEDEAVVARSIAMTLSQGGYEVSGCVTTGETAVTAAAATDGPDLILMDIHLRGDIDGIEAARRIRAFSDVPIVFLTAYADRDHIDGAKDALAHAYLIKPYTDRELLTTIEIALHKHQRDRELGSRARWLATTLRSLGDGVIVVDVQSGVTYVNQVAERMTGWTDDTASGRPLAEVLHLEDDGGSPARDLPVAQAIAGRTVHGLDRATYLRTRMGARLPVEVSVAPITETDGTLLGAVVVVRDISERHVLEARLGIAERLSAMVTMTAGLGHELNNPLTANLVNLELALERLAELRAQLQGSAAAKLGDVIDSLDDAHTGAIRMRDLIAAMRTVGRLEAGPRSPVALAGAVESALQLVSSEVELRATVTKEFRARPLVDGHEGRLAQVFTNLLINAAQSLPPEGDRGSIGIVVDETDDRAIVEIVDSGRGIPPDVMVRIFEPFFTTRPIGTGVGLGLAMVHGIVAAHGGEVSVESKPGVGSTFRVSLPRLRARAAAPPDPDPPLPQHQLHLLLIEDDPLVGHVTQELLEEVYVVRWVQSGREALEAVAARVPDVVLSDLMMPEMDGMQLYDALVASWPALAPRVVFYTGGAFTPRAEEFVSRHAARVLYKPVSPDVLFAAVARVAK